METSKANSPTPNLETPKKGLSSAELTAKYGSFGMLDHLDELDPNDFGYQSYLNDMKRARIENRARETVSPKNG